MAMAPKVTARPFPRRSAVARKMDDGSHEDFGQTAVVDDCDVEDVDGDNEEEDDDDDDLYGDLLTDLSLRHPAPSGPPSPSPSGATAAASAAAEPPRHSLTAQVAALEARVRQLESENARLRRNMGILFRTARAELGRLQEEATVEDAEDYRRDPKPMQQQHQGSSQQEPESKGAAAD